MPLYAADGSNSTTANNHGGVCNRFRSNGIVNSALYRSAHGKGFPLIRSAIMRLPDVSMPGL